MSFNKLTWNIAVDSNYLINKNKVLKWHLIYISDHFDGQSTASCFSNSQPSNLKGCEGPATASLTWVSIWVCIFTYINVHYTYTLLIHKHTLIHVYLRIIRWTSFHRYKADPGIWTPRDAAGSGLHQKRSAQNGVECLPLSGRSGGSDTLMTSTLVLTKEVSYVIATATLTWV